MTTQTSRHGAATRARPAAPPHRCQPAREGGGPSQDPSAALAPARYSVGATPPPAGQRPERESGRMQGRHRTSGTGRAPVLRRDPGFVGPSAPGIHSLAKSLIPRRLGVQPQPLASQTLVIWECIADYTLRIRPQPPIGPLDRAPRALPPAPPPTASARIRSTSSTSQDSGRARRWALGHSGWRRRSGIGRGVRGPR